jgi:hypothetical protein
MGRITWGLATLQYHRWAYVYMYVCMYVYMYIYVYGYLPCIYKYVYIYLATLQCHRWAGRAGWEAEWARLGQQRRPERPTRTTPSTGEDDSGYTVDRRGRLGIRAYKPRGTSRTYRGHTHACARARTHTHTHTPSWTHRVAREALACFQGDSSQPE